MRRRRRASAPALATYYATGAFPEFDPSAWEGETLYARWEAWMHAQTWADTLTAGDLAAWMDYADTVAPPMTGDDWVRAVGVDARRGGHLVRNGKRF